jgi:hypothetical protein
MTVVLTVAIEKVGNWTVWADALNAIMPTDIATAKPSEETRMGTIFLLILYMDTTTGLAVN